MYKELKKIQGQQGIFVITIPIEFKLNNCIDKQFDQFFYVVNSNLSRARGGPLGVVKKPCVKSYFKFNSENSSKEDPLKGSFKVKNYQFRSQMQVDKKSCKLIFRMKIITVNKNKMLLW